MAVTKNDLEKVLVKYLPPEAVGDCADLILFHKVQVKITRSRLSKFGDYRAPYNGLGHRISINHNLNPYAFLVTFIHEMAHLGTFNSHHRRVDPHGKEWKAEFKKLLDPFIESEIFPSDIKTALQVYILNPAASGCGDPVLYKALKNYDPVDHYTFLENLPEGCQFKMKGYNNIFIKGKLLRKSFHCRMKDSKREFRISGIAEVQQVSLF